MLSVPLTKRHRASQVQIFRWKGVSASTWTKRPSTSAAPPFTTSEMKTPGPLFLPTILQINQSFTLHSFYLRTTPRPTIQIIQKRNLLKITNKTTNSVYVSSDIILGEALLEASILPGTALKSSEHTNFVTIFLFSLFSMYLFPWIFG